MSDIKPLWLLGLVLVAGAATADTWSRSDDVGRNPVRRDTDDRFAFGAAGRVEIKGIGGNVRISAADTAEVQLHYERAAASQNDFDCEQLRVEHTAQLLTIRTERTQSPNCRSIRADDSLTLTVPRQAAVSVDETGDSVRITGVTGMVKLSSVGDSAVLDGIEQLRADSIGDSLKLHLRRIGVAGIHVDSIGDSVELELADGLGARLTIDSIGGEVRGRDLHLSSLGGGVRTVIGEGGPEISISSVGDDVVIH